MLFDDYVGLERGRNNRTTNDDIGFVIATSRIQNRGRTDRPIVEVIF